MNKYEEIIDRLNLWRDDPSIIEYDEIVPPTKKCIEKVKNYINEMYNKHQEMPNFVVPNGEAGIMMEFYLMKIFMTLEISDDNEELIIFKNHKIIYRGKYNE